MQKLIEKNPKKDYEKLNKIIGSSKINWALLKKLMQILKIENNVDFEKMFYNQLLNKKI